MSIKSRIIEKLEKDVEYSAGHIDLELLPEEKREKLFVQFGEGDENLTNFLRTAYNHGLPSLFCCSGHETRSAYVCLKITEKNIETAQRIGKILSNQGVVTNFTDDYMRGKYVHYRPMKDDASTEWLKTATEILENPEHFENIEPTIYYHEMMNYYRKPFGFDFKKKLLTYLRGRKEIPELTIKNNQEEKSPKSWELSQEEKDNINNSKRKNIDNNEKLYNESIILIGPSGAGKSTVAEEIHKKTNKPRLCLDAIMNEAMANGMQKNFRNSDEFYFYMISDLLEKTKQANSYGICDFGAGHSVYESEEIFEKVKSMLQPFKNIVLLLPSEDKNESLKIMQERSTGDTRKNKKFIESPCNSQLATMTVYGNGRTPSEIADEILEKINTRGNNVFEGVDFK